MRLPVALGCLFFVFNQFQGFANEVRNNTVAKTHTPSSRIQIGPNYTHASIRPHGHTTFNGNLGGAQGIYEYRPANNFYGGAKLAWRQGHTHSQAGSRSLLYADAQERLGYTFACSQNAWRWTFFSGVGYRHLGQTFNPKHSSSIKFRYNEIYIPVGTIINYTTSSWFGIGLAATWMPQVYPTVKIEPLKGARWILKDKISNFSVELPLTFILTASKRFSLILNPSYEYWQDGKSTAKTSSGIPLDLPSNTYNFWGLDLNLAYSF
jgi:hypothetical protein